MRVCIGVSLKQQGKYGLTIIATEEADGAIVEAHDLTRKAEADTSAVGFAGEKGYNTNFKIVKDIYKKMCIENNQYTNPNIHRGIKF